MDRNVDWTRNLRVEENKDGGPGASGRKKNDEAPAEWPMNRIFLVSEIWLFWKIAVGIVEGRKKL